MHRIWKTRQYVVSLTVCADRSNTISSVNKTRRPAARGPRVRLRCEKWQRAIGCVKSTCARFSTLGLRLQRSSRLRKMRCDATARRIRKTIPSAYKDYSALLKWRLIQIILCCWISFQRVAVETPVVSRERRPPAQRPGEAWLPSSQDDNVTQARQRGIQKILRRGETKGGTGSVRRWRSKQKKFNVKHRFGNAGATGC